MCVGPKKIVISGMLMKEIQLSLSVKVFSTTEAVSRYLKSPFVSLSLHLYFLTSAQCILLYSKCIFIMAQADSLLLRCSSCARNLQKEIKLCSF